MRKRFVSWFLSCRNANPQLLAVILNKLNKPHTDTRTRRHTVLVHIRVVLCTAARFAYSCTLYGGPRSRANTSMKPCIVLVETNGKAEGVLKTVMDGEGRDEMKLAGRDRWLEVACAADDRCARAQPRKLDCPAGTSDGSWDSCVWVSAATQQRHSVSARDHLHVMQRATAPQP